MLAVVLGHSPGRFLHHAPSAMTCTERVGLMIPPPGIVQAPVHTVLFLGGPNASLRPRTQAVNSAEVQ